jgi:S1-C subfamily serine protease
MSLDLPISCLPLSAAGNSGGPLLDSTGRLIGLNTAIFTPTGTSAGVGFAIPVDTVARVVPQLISSGRVLRPSLGVQVGAAARVKNHGCVVGFAMIALLL